MASRPVKTLEKTLINHFKNLFSGATLTRTSRSAYMNSSNKIFILSLKILLFCFYFIACFCVKTPTMSMSGIKESDFTRGNPKRSLTPTQRLCRRWIRSWRQANLTPCGWSLLSFMSSMVSWPRRG